MTNSPAPGLVKLPLLGVRATARRNPWRGVVGALAGAGTSDPGPLLLGVFRPLDACIVTAVPGRERTVVVPFRGGGRKPSLDPSRKISSRI